MVWSRRAPYGDLPLSILGQSVDMTTRLPDPDAQSPSLCSARHISTSGFAGWRDVFTDSVKAFPPNSSRFGTSLQASLLVMGMELAALLPKAQKWGLRRHRGRGGPHLEAFQETPGLTHLPQPGADGDPPHAVLSLQILIL